MSTTEITKPLTGLISLFGLRDMGSVPRTLESTITPGIDITEFALTDRESINFGNITANLVANWSFPGGTATVPAGELWYVHSFSLVTETIGAGEQIHMKPIISNASRLYGIGDRATGNPNEAVMAFSARPVLLTPGEQLQLLVEGITGSIVVTGYGLVTKLRM